MPAIKAISGGDIHRITSGQVIIDLTTAVKELLENSLDAGSTQITINIKNYGIDSIEVIDNGSGIDESDYSTICLKHYTSKLRTFEDVSKVSTLGFRGEALSSLCALSEVSIITSTKDLQPVAKKLEYDHSGQLQSTSFTSGQVGTTVSIKNLFNSLPVRRKDFIKNSKREFQKLLTFIQSYAIISLNCRISVNHIDSKGKRHVMMSTSLPSANKTVKHNLISIFGSNGNYGLHDIDINLELSSRFKLQRKDFNVNFKGYISNCSFGQGRSATDRQLMFINGRPVKLPQFLKVINEEYKQFNHLQYPCIILDMIIDPMFIDINVTPDKRSVLIHSESLIIEAFREELKDIFSSQETIIPKNVSNDSKVDGRSRTYQSVLNVNSYANYEKEEILKEDNVEGDEGEENEETNESEDSDDNIIEDTKNFLKSKEIEEEDPKEEDENQLDCNQHNGNDSEIDEEDVEEDEQESSIEDEHDEGNDSQEEGQFGNDATNEEEVQEVLHSVPSSRRSTRVLNTSLTSMPSLSDFKHSDEVTEQDISEVASNEDEVDETNLITEIPTYMSTRNKRKYVESKEDDYLILTMGNEEDQEVFESKLSQSQNGKLEFIDEEVDHKHDSNCDCHHQTSSSSSIKVKKEDEDEILQKQLKIDKKHSTHKFEMRIKVKDKLNKEECEYFNKRRKKDSINNLSKTDLSKEKIDDIADDVKAESLLTLTVSKSDFLKMKIIGQFNLGFILATREKEVKNEEDNSYNDLDLFIIDQHASDEKYNFEKLSAETIFQSQPLVVPTKIEISAIDELIVMNNIKVFEKNGFKLQIDESLEPGERISLKAIPFSKKTMFDISDFNELLYLIKENDSNSSEGNLNLRPSKTRSMFAMRACRSSIMIGKPLNFKTMNTVVRHLAELDKPWNCPHGRPTMRHLMELKSWAPFEEDYQ